MKAVLVNINGHDYLIRFEYIAETWDEPARIDIDEVMADGLSLQMSTKFIEQAEAEILAMYGKQLQDNAAEAAAIERDERAMS